MSEEEFIVKAEGMFGLKAPVREWLCQPISCKYGYLDSEIERPRWWRAFWLVTKNGGWEVGGWGFLSSGGPFGYGLEQDEALELMQINAFLAGAATASGEDILDELYPAYQEFLNYHEALKGEITG